MRHYDLALEYTGCRQPPVGQGDAHGRHPGGCRPAQPRPAPAPRQQGRRGRGPRLYTHRAASALVVHPRIPRARGREFTVSVTYQGNPTPCRHRRRRGLGGAARRRHRGSAAARRPSWFPCNDRPSNKASYRIEVATATAYHVAANGTLVEQRRGASRTTWVFDQPEPRPGSRDGPHRPVRHPPADHEPLRPSTRSGPPPGQKGGRRPSRGRST